MLLLADTDINIIHGQAAAARILQASRKPNTAAGEN
jgi:hypothetical protein